jgi:nucleoside-diphosphate-sugar epimerase
VASKKLIFGAGYLGARVAGRWQAAGDEVFVVTRSRQRADEFIALGLRAIVADVTVPESLKGLPSVETVLFAVGFDRAAGKPIEEVYVEGLQNVLRALPSTTGRIIYISSTGVYGDSGGDWVDEQTPCNPQRAGGQACLAAEQFLMSPHHDWGEKSIVLRLAGLYGPGRIPRRESLLAGEPIPAPSEGFLNLIHVDDAVSVVLAAEKQANCPRVYNVSDGRPGRRTEYYEELARLVGAPPPRFVAPPPASPAAQRAASDKRIGNVRMREELRVELRFPSFREGLAAIVVAR